MKIDTGMAIVIVAVLVFYLRLIIIQRERAKRIRASTAVGSSKKKSKPAAQVSEPGFSILSQNTLDRVIAGVGVLAILAGILLNMQIIPLPAVQPYWWLPTALGVVAFSWAFK